MLLSKKGEENRTNKTIVRDLIDRFALCNKMNNAQEDSQAATKHSSQRRVEKSHTETLFCCFQRFTHSNKMAVPKKENRELHTAIL